MADILDALRKFIEEWIPALAVALWSYEEAKVDQAKSETEQAQVALQVEENHESVDQKYVGVPDSDVVNDAISNGGGSGGQLETGDADVPATSTGDNGNGLVKAKPDSGS